MASPPWPVEARVSRSLGPSIPLSRVGAFARALLACFRPCSTRPHSLTQPHPRRCRYTKLLDSYTPSNDKNCYIYSLQLAPVGTRQPPPGWVPTPYVKSCGFALFKCTPISKSSG